MAYLVKVPYFREEEEVLDSQYIFNAEKEMVFSVPLKETDRQFKLKISKSDRQFYFVPDSKDINITVNNINGHMNVTGSVATLTLLQFKAEQQKLIDSSEKLLNVIKQTNKNKSISGNVFYQSYNSIVSLINKRYKNFADTVSNAAVFLSVYNNIIFDGDPHEMISFLKSGKKRFPDSRNVAQLYDDAERIENIYLKEFNVGEKLPFITLLDINGNLFSTSSLQNKYYFIDFWASWCDHCRIYNYYKNVVNSSVDKNKLQIVSIALDDNTQTIKALIRQQNLNWVQLVDTAMWMGNTSATFGFDSIPMNFLVAPGGTIIGKAIKPDSLLSFITKRIK